MKAEEGWIYEFDEYSKVEFIRQIAPGTAENKKYYLEKERLPLLRRSR